MIKKMLAVVFVGVLALGAVACSDAGEGEGTDGGSEAVTS